MYSIGQLSKKTGVTIRTLDYYDEIGLITPSSSTEGGHRLYKDTDAMRLQQVLSLKYMGFSLQQIRKVLEESTSTWEQSLEQQLKMIQRKQKHLEKLNHTVQAVLYSVQFEEDVKWPVIFEMIQLFNKETEIPGNLFDQYLNDYFKPDDREAIENLDDQMNESNFQEWKEIIHAVREHLTEDPSSDVAQQLAKQWLDKVDVMFSGNVRLKDKMWKTIKDNSDDIIFYPMDQEVVDFIDKATTIMNDRKKSQHKNRTRESRGNENDQSNTSDT